MDKQNKPISKNERKKLVSQNFTVPEGMEYLPDVVYGTGGARPLHMEIVKPISHSSKPRPVIVLIHGGGWIGGTHKVPQNAANWARHGFVGVSVEYRLSGEAPFPAALEDCKAAIRYLRAHAHQYGIDADRIGVTGGSAGGHLSSLVGVTGDIKDLEGCGGWEGYSSAIQAVAPVSGPTDLGILHAWGVSQVEFRMARYKGTPMEEEIEKMRKSETIAKFLGCDPRTNPEKLKRVNPITYVKPGLPPFKIIHGEVDPLVPIWQAQLLYNALKETGNDVTFIPVPNMMHNRQIGAYGDPLETDVNGIIVDFFIKHLK